MSYEHLAGRLVEIQRSMVGQSAVTIAQSIDGISITDDGNVTSIDDDPCAVLDELVENYTAMLGDPAATRFRTAATEYKGELDLPESLGGSVTPPRDDDADDQAVETPADHDEDEQEAAATSIEISSPREEESPVSGLDVSGRSDTPTEGVETESGTVDGSVMVRYSLQADSTDPDADLDSVYLMTESEDDWQAPVTVADAIASAVTSASGLDREEFDDIEEYVETDRVLSTLDADGGPPVTFHVQDLTVTLYSDGTVRVHAN